MKLTKKIRGRLVILAALVALPAACYAQAAYQAPRTPDGHPDLQGIWQVSDTSLAYNLEPHTPQLGIPAGIGAITNPADGKIPYTPAGRQQQERNFEMRVTADPLKGCYLPGVPRMMTLSFPFQVVQTGEVIVLLSEYAHATRNIFMQGEHLDNIELWMGDSRGHWEGDTLVVDVIDFLPDTWLDAAGNHHSGELHIVERWTRTGPNTLQYEATLEDKNVYTQPWTMRVLFYRHQEPNFRVLEYECFAYEELEAMETNN